MLGKLNGISWDKHFFNETKIQIYTSIVRSRLCRVFTNIYSLLIEKDGRASLNISIQFVYACPSVISSIPG